MTMLDYEQIDLHDLRARSRRVRPSTVRPSIFHVVDTYQGQVTDPITLHKYIYCNDNPISGIDPSGHMDISIPGLLVGMGITTVLTGIGAYEGNKLTHSVRGTLWGAAAGLDTGIVITEALATGNAALLLKMGLLDAVSVLVALAKDASSFPAVSPAKHWEDVFQAVAVANGSLAVSYITAGFADKVIRKYVDGTHAQAWIAGANSAAIQATSQWATGGWKKDWKKALGSVVTSAVVSTILTYQQNDLTMGTVDATTAGVVAGRIWDAVYTVIEKAPGMFK